MPLGNGDVKVITGGGVMVIVTEAIALVLAEEVAVTIAVVDEVTEAGALYVTEVLVSLASMPGPERLHVTFTLAVRLIDCP